MVAAMAGSRKTIALDSAVTACDELRIRGQRDIFLGAGPDGFDGGIRVVAGTAGDDRQADAFGFQALDQAADVEAHIAHHQVRALAGAQRVQGRFDIFGMGNFRPAGNGNLAGGADLAVQRPDDD
jgi:hypothetical protein